MKSFKNILMPSINNQNNLLPQFGNNINVLDSLKIINIQQLEREINSISVHKSSGIQHLSACF